MDNRLKDALKNPSVVLTSGPRAPDTRPSVKKANGLLRLGAAVMLGVALLSPLNALAAQQNVPLPAQDQTTEIVVNEQGEPDWFASKVEGRVWTNAPTVAGQAFHTPTWVKYGVVTNSPHEIARLEALAENASAKIGGDERPQEATPEKSADDVFTAFKKEQEEKEIRRAKDGPEFSLAKNRYNLMKKIDLSDASFKEASPKEQNYFISRLVRDAYIEMKAGYTTEAPSQNLINICQHVEDIGSIPASAAHVEHGQEIFQACHSDQMQSNMLVNTVLKGVSYAGIGLAGLLAKGVAVVGFMEMAGSAFSTETQKPSSFEYRLNERRAASQGPQPDENVLGTKHRLGG